MFAVAVCGFEDVTTSTGEVVTMYIIRVQYSEKSSFFIAKRYSDFTNLYGRVKDNIHDRDPYYKFPNKSMFNTSAMFTKERRMRGFDEMLKLLASIYPLPKELHQFLELSQRISHGSVSQVNVRRRSASSAEERNVRTVGASQQVSDETLMREAVSQYQSQNGKIETVRVNLPKVLIPSLSVLLPSSMKISFGSYIILIILGFIDISNCSVAQLCVTILSLGLLCTYIRIIKMKMMIS
jgi:hypothetical protein